MSKELTYALAVVTWIVLFHLLARMRWCEPLRRRFGNGTPFALFSAVCLLVGIPMLAHGLWIGLAPERLARSVAAFTGSLFEYAIYFYIAHIVRKAWQVFCQRESSASTPVEHASKKAEPPV